jgi:nucleoside transporter
MHDTTNDTLRSSHKFSLSVMMFLQYAVWGVWLPVIGNYLHEDVAKGGLGFSWAQIGMVVGLAGSIGAVLGPFLAGQVADRFMNAERYLGILLILGGIVKYLNASVHDYTTFLWLSVLYSVLYSPTLALTNSIAMTHLKNRERDFPIVRTWGTIGWIAASLVFPAVWLMHSVHLDFKPWPRFAGSQHLDATARLADSLRAAGIVSVVYGVWAVIFLPRTLPTKNPAQPLAFVKAFALLKHQGFLVATLAAVPIAMIHQVFFLRTGTWLEACGFMTSRVQGVMALGQISEIVCMAGLGVFLKRLGYRTVLALGCTAFALRYGLFALLSPENSLGDTTRMFVLLAMLLHGFCYAFFFAAAYVFIDRIATPDIRHSVQTVFGIMILGVGPSLAVFYNASLDSWTGGKWSTMWAIQAGIGAACALVIAALFRGPSKQNLRMPPS